MIHCQFNAIIVIVAWRVFWLTMMNRTSPNSPAATVLTDTEIEILDLLGKTEPPKKKTVAHYLIEIAKIGGYLARERDPPPGNMIIWRGLSRLTDIHMGFELNASCG